MAKILFVDDIPAEIRPQVTDLRADGHEVEVLISEKELRSKKKGELSEYRIIVIDLGIVEKENDQISGQVKGINLLKYLKIDSELRDDKTKLIVYSVVRKPEIVNAIRSYGADYLQKLDEDLYRAINKYLK